MKNNYSRQAILTRFIGPTNSRGARIKAYCERGSITIPYPHELNSEDAHIAAFQALLAKFEAEDKKRFGMDNASWGTRDEWNIGALPQSNRDAYVFVK